MLDRARAAQLLARHGQEHVLRHFDTLSPRGQARLLAQIASLDLPWLEQVYAAGQAAAKSDHHPARQIAPCREVTRPGDPDALRAADRGGQALKAGRVGVLVVAGGQGTRLGFDGPKGAFPLGAVSGRTLFQIHAERLLAAGKRYGQTPPLYLMTSEANHEQTCRLFEEHDRFGLPKERVLIFQQGVAPAVDEAGKLLLDEPEHIVTAPNGNGGLFAALARSGAFAHMTRMGVDTISYIHVDNPLAPPCDPVFVGLHLLRRSEFSCKAITKTGPREKVGSYALVDGRLAIVEYTELPDELAGATDEKGELLFGLSNPGLFVWSRAFAERQAARPDLPFHRAHKKVSHLDEKGALVRPERPNGYKFEAFAMDTLAAAERTALLFCEREAEFAPVKNATGADSPRSARELMTRIYASWIEQAGGRVISSEAQIEISPLLAEDATELARRLTAPLVVSGDLYLVHHELD